MSSKKNIKTAKIAISGKSGCGNTTLSRLLADTLGLRFINFTFRSLAQEKGMDYKEILKLAAKDDSWDREVDIRQAQMAREEGGCVLGSRLAIWMLPEADLKVFLVARPETRTVRIQAREGGILEEIAEFTTIRDKQDRERYMRIYNIDNDDYSFADLVINTDELMPEEVMEQIVVRLSKKFKA